MSCNPFKIKKTFAQTNHYRKKCKLLSLKGSIFGECFKYPKKDLTMWKYLAPLDTAVKNVMRKLHWEV